MLQTEINSKSYPAAYERDPTDAPSGTWPATHNTHNGAVLAIHNACAISSPVSHTSVLLPPIWHVNTLARFDKADDDSLEIPLGTGNGGGGRLLLSAIVVVALAVGCKALSSFLACSMCSLKYKKSSSSSTPFPA